MADRDVALRIARVLLYLGLFLSPFLVIRSGGTTLSDIVMLASFGLTALGSIAIGTFTPAARTVAGAPAGVLIVAIVIGGGLATVNALQPGESVLVVARLIYLVVLLPWQMATLFQDHAQLWRAVKAVAVGGALCCGGTLIQAQFGSESIPGTDITNAGRFSGFTQNVSDLGGVASLSLVLTLSWFLSKPSGRGRLASLGCIALSLIGLLLSGSVSGMIAAAVGMLVLIVRRMLKFRYVLLIGLVGVGTTYVVFVVQAATQALSPIDRFNQALGLSGQGRYNTSGSRIETYQAAFQKFVETPLVGHGLDTQSSIVDGTFPAHNLILAAAFGGGVLLAAAVTAGFLRPLRGRWLRSDRSPLTTAIFAAFGAAVVFAMTAPSLYNRYFWIPVAFLFVARALHRVTRAGAAQSVLQATRPGS